MGQQGLATTVRDKILESIERTIHLVGLVPVGRLEWRPHAADFADVATGGAGPSEGQMDLGHLLGHLLDCAAGFCAVLQAAYPTQLSDFDRIRKLEVNHSCHPNETVIRLQQYSDCIARGFELCTDQHLARNIPTVFAAEGETLITLLLGNFEHLINHKYQLFFYLKLLNVPVNSADLYSFRGHPSSDGAR